jgi:hypothetical protein
MRRKYDFYWVKFRGEWWPAWYTHNLTEFEKMKPEYQEYWLMIGVGYKQRLFDEDFDEINENPIIPHINDD